MTNRIESASQTISRRGSAAKRQRALNVTGEGSVLAEFSDAVQSTAVGLMQEQKQQIADRVSGVAEALERAAQSLDQSQNRAFARYVQDAGQQVRNFSGKLQQLRWNELVRDVEYLARNQQTWFVMGAVAFGFVVGRLLWTTANLPSSSVDPQEGMDRDTSREVTASSSTPATSGGTGEVSDYASEAVGEIESLFC